MRVTSSTYSPQPCTTSTNNEFTFFPQATIRRTLSDRSYRTVAPSYSGGSAGSSESFSTPQRRVRPQSHIQPQQWRDNYASTKTTPPLSPIIRPLSQLPESPTLTSSALSFTNYTAVSHTPGDSNSSTLDDSVSPFSSPSTGRIHKPYLQHAVSATHCEIPKHSISSSRMSRHFRLTPQQADALATPASLQLEDAERRSNSTPQPVLSQTPAKSEPEIHPTLVDSPLPPLPLSKENSAGSRQDSLLVNVMVLPKNFNMHNTSLSNIAPPSQSSTRSSLMSVVPPMSNVWLDDDDDDSDNANFSSRKENIKSMIRQRQMSTSSVARSKDASHHENTTDIAIRRRNRRSFGQGSQIDGGKNVFDKIKNSFSSKPQPTISTASIKVINPLWDEPHCIRPATPPPSTILASIPATPPTPKSQIDISPQTVIPASPSLLRRHDSVSRLPTSASARATRVTDPPSPRAHQRSQSTTNKLISLLSSKGPKGSKGHRLHRPSMDTLLGAPLGGGLDKKYISAPSNFVHTEHMGGSFEKMHSSATAVSRLKTMPVQPDKSLITTKSTNSSNSVPPLCVSSSDSLHQSSLLASPSTVNATGDDISVATNISGEDYSSPYSLNVQHKLLYAKLSTASNNSSLNSSDHEKDHHRQDRFIRTRQSADSLKSFSSTRSSFSKDHSTHNSMATSERSVFTNTTSLYGIASSVRGSSGRRSRSNTTLSMESGVSNISAPLGIPALPLAAGAERHSLFLADDRRIVLPPGAAQQQQQQQHQQQMKEQKEQVLKQEQEQEKGKQEEQQHQEEQKHQEQKQQVVQLDKANDIAIPAASVSVSVSRSKSIKRGWF